MFQQKNDKKCINTKKESSLTFLKKKSGKAQNVKKIQEIKTFWRKKVL